MKTGTKMMLGSIVAIILGCVFTDLKILDITSKVLWSCGSVSAVISMFIMISENS